MLFHCISAESENPKKEYLTIRKELGTYKKELLKKEEFILLTKSDVVDAKTLQKKIALFKKMPHSATPLSIYDEESMKKIKIILNKIQKEKNKDPQ